MGLNNKMDNMTNLAYCNNDCGFFSNGMNEGYCSVCYKEIIKKREASYGASPTTQSATPRLPFDMPTVPSATLTNTCTSYSDTSASVSFSGTSTSTPSTTTSSISLTSSETTGMVTTTAGKKCKNRCLTCKKKVGLTGFNCRCGGLFCSMHRYADEHTCQFDYKALGAKEISQNNPLIIATKVAKI